MTVNLEELRNWVRRITTLPSAQHRADAWEEVMEDGQPLWIHLQAWALLAPFDDRALADGYTKTTLACQAYLDQCTKHFGVAPKPRYLLQGRRVVWTWDTQAGAKRVGFECAAPGPTGVQPDRWRQLSREEIEDSESLQAVQDLVHMPCDQHPGSSRAECGCQTLPQLIANEGSRESLRVARDMASFDFATTPPPGQPDDQAALDQAKANMEGQLAALKKGADRFCLCGVKIPVTGPDKCANCHEREGPKHCAFCGKPDRMDDPLEEGTLHGKPAIAHKWCWHEHQGETPARVKCDPCTNYLEAADTPAEVYHEEPACEDGQSRARLRDEAQDAVEVEDRDPSLPPITWAPSQDKATACAECGYPPQAHGEGAYPPIACDRFREPGGEEQEPAAPPATEPLPAPKEEADVVVNGVRHTGEAPDVIMQAANQSPLVKALKEGFSGAQSTGDGPGHEWVDDPLHPAEEGMVEIAVGPEAVQRMKDTITSPSGELPSQAVESVPGDEPQQRTPGSAAPADPPESATVDEGGSLEGGVTTKPEGSACDHPSAGDVCSCGHPWEHHDHTSWACARCGCGRFELRNEAEEAKADPSYASVILERGLMEQHVDSAFCCLCGFSLKVHELGWREWDGQRAHTNWAHDDCMLKELKRVGYPLTEEQAAGFELRRAGRAGEAEPCKCGCGADEHFGPGKRCMRCPCVLYRSRDPGSEPEPLISSKVQEGVKQESARDWALQADLDSPKKQRKCKKQPTCKLCEAEIVATQKWVAQKGKTNRHRAHLECVLHVLKEVAAQ